MAQDCGGGDENSENSNLYFIISDRVPNRFQNEAGRNNNILIYIYYISGSIPPLGTTFPDRGRFRGSRPAGEWFLDVSARGG